MAIGDNNNADSRQHRSITEYTARQQEVEGPKMDTATGGTISQVNPTVGDKDILFGRGKSIRQRNANTRLLNFVDIFQDHYSVSGPFQRNQIVRWIIEMLQNDGYSFRRRSRQYPPSSSAIISDSSGCEEDVTDESESENMDDHIATENNNSWVKASPEEVQKNVAQLFQKPLGRFINAPSVTVTQSRWRRQHNHHQQQHDAFHQAISSAIDTNSLAATLRNEELQQQEQQVAALNQAISSAIDTSSLARDLRDCPSPTSPLVMSTSTSSSSFDPLLPLPPNPDLQEQEDLELGSFLLPELAAPLPPIEQQSSETETLNGATYSSEQKYSTSATAMHAQKLLQTHSSVSSGVDKDESMGELPKDGVLWSRGTREIRLLERMETKVIPVTSCSLFPSAQHDVFEKKAISKAETTTKVVGGKNILHQSKTIGYTEQRVGSITILRPIILLPEKS